MGGILCRACLMYLDLSKYHLEFIMTLASPHLGVSSN